MENQEDTDKDFAGEIYGPPKTKIEYDDWNIGTNESDILSGDSVESIYVNPAETMRMLIPKEPMTINELREKNPRLAVDYLFQRKEKWKSAATQLNKKSIQLNKKIKDLLVEDQAIKNRFFSLKSEVAKKEKETKHWKRKFRQEVDMKKWWRNAFAISAGLTAITIIVMIVITIQTTLSRPESQFVPRIPTSGAVQNTPNRVLSSVLIYNGKIQGSGTVISKGEEYSAVITAAHNFKGEIGGQCWLYYPDGTFTRATLAVHDTERDLAIVKVPSSTIVGNSFVPKEMSGSTSFTCVGYSNGQGPNMNNLKYKSTYKNSSKKYMWQVTLNDGTIWDGASGGGVFLGDACIGVTSQRDALVYVPQNGQYVQSKNMYAVCHQEVLNFLEENKNEIQDCGDWSVEPESLYGGDDPNTPPLWTPNPNVPVNLPGNNLATLKEDVNQLKKAVFGSQKQPDVISEPTDDVTQDKIEELAEGQKRPDDIPLPTAPKE